MKNSWTPNTDWSVETAWQALEDLGKQFKRNVDMRMRRGDVKSAILRLLAESPMHGYQIIHEIEARSGGAWKPSPGSVYPTLQLLTDEGLIEAQESEGRRTYSLTVTGREVAEAESESAPPWLAGSEKPVGPRGLLATSGLHVAKAAAEVAKRGDSEQMKQVAQLLDETTQAIDKVLSQK